MEQDILNELYAITEMLEKVTGYQQEIHDRMHRLFWIAVFILALMFIVLGLALAF